jgi:hypothetical protein
MDFYLTRYGFSELEFLNLVGYEFKKVGSDWTWKSPKAMSMASFGVERLVIDDAWADVVARVLRVLLKTEKKLTAAQWYVQQSGLMKSTFGVDSLGITFSKAAARVLHSVKLTHHNQVVTFWKSLYFDPQPESGYDATQKAMALLRDLRQSGAADSGPSISEISCYWDGACRFVSEVCDQTIQYDESVRPELVAVVPRGGVNILVHRHEGVDQKRVLQKAEEYEDASYYLRMRVAGFAGDEINCVVPTLYTIGVLDSEVRKWVPFPVSAGERQEIERVAIGMEMLCNHNDIFSPMPSDPIVLPRYPSTVLHHVSDYISVVNKGWTPSRLANFRQRRDEFFAAQTNDFQRERPAAA